jgi:hypothetical protein
MPGQKAAGDALVGAVAAAAAAATAAAAAAAVVLVKSATIGMLNADFSRL